MRVHVQPVQIELSETTARHILHGHKTSAVVLGVTLCCSNTNEVTGTTVRYVLLQTGMQIALETR